MLANIKSKQPRAKWAELNSPEQVYQNLHGRTSQIVPVENLGANEDGTKATQANDVPLSMPRQLLRFI
jgi:hypothetical protein